MPFLTLTRKWLRLYRRGRELAGVLPDPSLLGRGLDRLVASVFAGNKQPNAAFHIASFKLERQLEYKATEEDTQDYAHLILGEVEAALLAEPVDSKSSGKAGRRQGRGQGKTKRKKEIAQAMLFLAGRDRMPFWGGLRLSARTAGPRQMLGMWLQRAPQAELSSSWRTRAGRKGWCCAWCRCAWSWCQQAPPFSQRVVLRLVPLCLELVLEVNKIRVLRRLHRAWQVGCRTSQ